MPSSTFVFRSRKRPAAAAAAALLAGCIGIAVFAEGVVRVELDRVSKIQRRTIDEYRGALGQGRGSRGSVLFVGNSLLLEGVQFETLRERLAPAWDARRLVIEQTVYYDWYYGLRHLLQAGARPDVVVMMLGPLHWMSDEMRGDYSAQYLLSVGDAVSVARDLHMHPTQATSFVIASVSKFWGARAEIRNFILGRLMPDVDKVLNYATPSHPDMLVDDEVERAVVDRFDRCRRLTEAYGARLVVLVPPMIDPIDGSSGMIRAGRRVRVPVYAPAPAGTYPQSYYRDRFHLNEIGARHFTEKLVESMRAEFSAVPMKAQAERSATLTPTP